MVLADEINRATPRTQSALLEAMSDRQVTLDGQTRPLGPPFFVLATQNPYEFEGTYPLPESQLDRFLLRLHVGYPDRAAERGILTGHRAGEPVDNLQPVLGVRGRAGPPAGRPPRQGRGERLRLPARPRGRDATHADVHLGASTRACAGADRACAVLALVDGRISSFPTTSSSWPCPSGSSHSAAGRPRRRRRRRRGDRRRHRRAHDVPA